MKIGTIGAGEVAQAFAEKAIGAGHEVTFSNRRGPDALAGLVEALGPRASAALPQEATQRDVVLLAVPWTDAEASLAGLGNWQGRILIDAINGFDRAGRPVFGAETSSERIAELARGARVVKAMNAIFMQNFRKDPTLGTLRRALFISGDDAAANETAADLFESMGFAPVLLGSLGRGGRMQAVGSTLAGHDFYLPWPAPRAFPHFNGEDER